MGIVDFGFVAVLSALACALLIGFIYKYRIFEDDGTAFTYFLVRPAFWLFTGGALVIFVVSTARWLMWLIVTPIR